jgi:hypothetical protein
VNYPSEADKKRGDGGYLKIKKTMKDERQPIMISSLFVTAKSATSSKQNRRHQSSNPAPVHKNPETDRPTQSRHNRTKQDCSSRSFGKSSLKRRWKASTAGKEKEGEEETGFPKNARRQGLFCPFGFRPGLPEEIAMGSWSR